MKRKLFSVLFTVLLFTASVYGGTIRIEDASSFSAGYCSADGSRQNSYTGADNGFYVNLSNSSARGISWKVSAAAGSYTLRWRYANGGSSSATVAKILVNGTTAVSSVSFPKTSSWSTWSTATATVNLPAGVNTIRLETTLAAEFANIDWIEVTGSTTPTAASCSGSTTTTYTLSSTSSAGGSISVNPSGGAYAAGTVVTLTATPASGYKFDGWSGAVTGTANPVSVTMNANKAVTASFSPTTSGQYTLTVSTSGSGTVSKNPNLSSYAAGTVVTLTAAPASGYKFSGWSGAVSGTTSSVSVTMNANKNVTATFTSINTPPPATGLVGYATLNGGTKGGQGGATRTISTLADLQAWALTRENNTTPEIVYISGKISASSTTTITIKYGGNISILGIGSTAELQNIGLNIRAYNNVIVRNLKIHEVFYPSDALTIDECQNVWVDHCELYSKKGPGIGVDTYDGLLDIKKGSKYVTVSWCYLHDHMKTVLIGHTDNTGQQAQDSQMRITFHHNYFYNTNGRNPSLRFGVVHLYNNYFRNIDDYGIAVRQGARALIENNVYENVVIPITTNKFDGPAGYACERGNIFTASGANSITQTGCDWWTSANLPYAYSLDPTSSVTTNVPANVGVGKINTGAKLAIPTSIENGAELLVSQNYPNPLEGATTIKVWLKEAAHVKIVLYNYTGNHISILADDIFKAGNNEIRYDGSSLKPGVYFYEVKTGKGTIQKRMLVK